MGGRRQEGARLALGPWELLITSSSRTYNRLAVSKCKTKKGRDAGFSVYICLLLAVGCRLSPATSRSPAFAQRRLDLRGGRAAELDLRARARPEASWVGERVHMRGVQKKNALLCLLRWLKKKKQVA